MLLRGRPFLTDETFLLDGGHADPPTYALSDYFNAISEQLLSTTVRQDGNQHNLRNAAYSALMALVRSAAQDCYPNVQRVTLIILERLEVILSSEAPHVGQDRTHFDDLQSLLCGTLQSVLRKINKEDAPVIADKVRMIL